jgi:hypothetical protein
MRFVLSLSIAAALSFSLAHSKIVREPELQAELLKALENLQTIEKIAEMPACALCESKQVRAPAETVHTKRPRSKTPLFNQQAGFELEIRGPFPLNRGSPGGNGKISYQIDGKAESILADFELRGVTRISACPTFPPFKITLEKGRKGTLFDKSDRDLKVVTHCEEPSIEESLEQLRQEYTAYRMIESAGLASLLAQLVKITYVNPQTGFHTSQEAIILENIKDTGKRLLGKHEPGSTTFEPPSEAEAEVAERLLLNTDWAFGSQRYGLQPHNIKVAQTSDKTGNAPEIRRGISIPYDFDLAGMIVPSEAFKKYFPNETASKNSDYSKDRQILQEMLRINVGYQDELRTAIRKVITNHSKVIEAIDLSPMNAANKARFKARVDHFVTAAQESLRAVKN